MYSWNIHVSVLKLTAKLNKHGVRNIIFSKASGQDNNISEQTASQQVLSYLNVHLFAIIASIQQVIWEVGVRGIHPPLVSQLLEMV